MGPDVRLVLSSAPGDHPGSRRETGGLRRLVDGWAWKLRSGALKRRGHLLTVTGARKVRKVRVAQCLLEVLTGGGTFQGLSTTEAFVGGTY